MQAKLVFSVFRRYWVEKRVALDKEHSRSI